MTALDLIGLLDQTGLAALAAALERTIEGIEDLGDEESNPWMENAQTALALTMETLSTLADDEEISALMAEARSI